MILPRFVAIFSLVVFGANAQVLDKLTVDKIMRHPKWIGVAPTSPHWSPDSKTIYFYWNPESAVSDSLYAYNVTTKSIRKTTASERLSGAPRTIHYNNAFTQGVYEKNGDIFLYDVATKKISQVSNTT